MVVRRGRYTSPRSERRGQGPGPGQGRNADLGWTKKAGHSSTVAVDRKAVMMGPPVDDYGRQYERIEYIMLL
jgi:hypothetical protein